MSKPDWKNEIDGYVSGVDFGVLAYVRADGTPVQRRFGSFARREQTVFFSTRTDSAKVKELRHQPRVSFLFEAEGQKLSEWKSALFLGKAAEVHDEQELALAVDLLSARNPRFKERIKGGLTNTTIYSLHTDEIEITDYSKGIGYSKKISIVTNEEV